MLRRLATVMTAFALSPLTGCDVVAPESSDRRAGAHVGPIVECGAGSVAERFCRQWAAGAGGPLTPTGWFARRVCSGSVEAFAACDDWPGGPGAHCEICAGVGTDVAKLPAGPVSAAAEAGLLYCYGWDTDAGIGSGSGEYVTFGGGSVEIGPHAAGVSLSCGGYGTPGEARGPMDRGVYCTASTYFDLTPLGLPLTCELGVILLDPDEFIDRVRTALGRDPVVDDGELDPTKVAVPCQRGREATLASACYDALGGYHSGIVDILGEAVSCKDVWEGECHRLGGCSDLAVSHCEELALGCRERSAAQCARSDAEADVVTCLPGDTRASLDLRCRRKSDGEPSSARDRDGNPISCRDIRRRRCGLFSDCPAYAVAYCDALQSQCTNQSVRVCAAEGDVP